MLFLNFVHGENLSAIPSLEPFVERIQGLDECRIGYRRRDGEIVSAIVVSVSLLGEALYSSSLINLTLSADGFISASLSEPANSAGIPRSARAIDDLLRSTLSKRNLHLEEASTSQLLALLSRLEVSVSMVRHAVDQMTD
jgi:hypothetical protein